MKLTLTFLFALCFSAQAPVVLTGNSVVRNAVIASAPAAGFDWTAAGLVHYWPMTEASGTRNDTKGSLNLSETGGSIGSASGINGLAANFSGNSSKSLRSGAFAAWSGATSVGVWFKLNSVTSSSIFFRDGSGGEPGYIQQNTASGGSLTGAIGVDFDILVTTPPLSTGVWHLAVLTVAGDGLGQNLFLDNVCDDCNGPQGGPVVADNIFTTGSANSLDAIDGLIGPIFICNTVLSQSQVTQLWNSGSGVFYP